MCLYKIHKSFQGPFEKNILMPLVSVAQTRMKSKHTSANSFSISTTYKLIALIIHH